MAIPLNLSEVPNLNPYIQYVATSSQTVFPYPFPITQDADLIAVVNGVTLNTDSGYTLSGQGNDTGGNLTFTIGRTAGDIITLYRDIPIERVTQISQNSGFSSTAFNAEFNNLYLIAQQLEASIGQCLQIPNTNNPAPTTLLQANAYAGKYLAFDAYGNPTPAILTTSGSLTQSIIGALLNPQTYWEILLSILPSNKAFGAPDIKRYGAAGDGVTDDTGAIQNALSTGMDIYMSPGVYLVSSTLKMKSRFQRLYGAGILSEIRFTFASGTTDGIVISEDDSTTFGEQARIDHLYLHATANVRGVIGIQGPNPHVHSNYIVNTSASGGGHGIYCADLNESSPPFVESFGYRIYNNFIYGQSSGIISGSAGIHVGDRNLPWWIHGNLISFFDTLIQVNGACALAEVAHNYLINATTYGIDFNPPSGGSVVYNPHTHDNYIELVPVSIALRAGIFRGFKADNNYSFSHASTSSIGPAPFVYVGSGINSAGQLWLDNNTIEGHSSALYLNSASISSVNGKGNTLIGGIPWTDTGASNSAAAYATRHFNSGLLAQIVSGSFLSRSASRVEGKNTDFQVPVLVTTGEVLNNITFVYSPNSGTGCTVNFYKSPSSSASAATSLANVTVSTSTTATLALSDYIVEAGYNYYLEAVYDNTGTSGYIYPFVLSLSL